MTDTTKAISVVTAIHKRFCHLVNEQYHKSPPRWFRRFINAPIPAFISMERNYSVAHRTLPYTEALIVQTDAPNTIKEWVKNEIDFLIVSLGGRGRPTHISAGRFVVILEVETTADGIIYGFVVKERIQV